MDKFFDDFELAALNFGVNKLIKQMLLLFLVCHNIVKHLLQVIEVDLKQK